MVTTYIQHQKAIEPIRIKSTKIKKNVTNFNDETPATTMNDHERKPWYAQYSTGGCSTGPCDYRVVRGCTFIRMTGHPGYTRIVTW